VEIVEIQKTKKKKENETKIVQETAESVVESAADIEKRKKKKNKQPKPNGTLGLKKMTRQINSEYFVEFAF